MTEEQLEARRAAGRKYDRANKEKRKAARQERTRLGIGWKEAPYSEFSEEKKQAKRESAKRTIEKRRALSQSLMVPCAHCGAFDVRFMDWHHRDASSKTESIAKMISNKRSDKTITEEIAKCDCLCSNCHRIHHDEHGYR